MDKPDSKRWMHFHSALQLAINRAAHKWTYEDFQECFALWCKEEPHGSEAIFNTISRHMEDQTHASCETIFKDFSVRESINVLHEVVTAARARKQRGETGAKDIWREDLTPHAAVRAMTIPVLEAEVEKLKATLRGESLFLEEENAALSNQAEAEVQRQKEAEAKTAELFEIFDYVYEKWSNLSHDEINLFALQAAENLPPTQPI